MIWNYNPCPWLQWKLSRIFSIISFDRSIFMKHLVHVERSKWLYFRLYTCLRIHFLCGADVFLVHFKECFQIEFAIARVPSYGRRWIIIILLWLVIHSTRDLISRRQKRVSTGLFSTRCRFEAISCRTGLLLLRLWLRRCLLLLWRSRSVIARRRRILD